MTKRKTQTALKNRFEPINLREACAGCLYSKIQPYAESGVECSAELFRVCMPFTKRICYKNK